MGLKPTGYDQDQNRLTLGICLVSHQRDFSVSGFHQQSFRNPLWSLFYLQRHFKVFHRTGRFFFSQQMNFQRYQAEEEGPSLVLNCKQMFAYKYFYCYTNSTCILEMRICSCERFPLIVIYGPDPAY